MTDRAMPQLNKEDLLAAAKYARVMLRRFSGEKLYHVYCPDDLCAELEMNGIPAAAGQNEGDGFAAAALDMDISVIHELADRAKAEYTCREDAMWNSVLLLEELAGENVSARLLLLLDDMQKNWRKYRASSAAVQKAAESEDES